MSCCTCACTCMDMRMYGSIPRGRRCCQGEHWTFGSFGRRHQPGGLARVTAEDALKADLDRRVLCSNLRSIATRKASLCCSKGHPGTSCGHGCQTRIPRAGALRPPPLSQLHAVGVAQCQEDEPAQWREVWPSRKANQLCRWEWCSGCHRRFAVHRPHPPLQIELSPEASPDVQRCCATKTAQRRYQYPHVAEIGQCGAPVGVGVFGRALPRDCVKLRRWPSRFCRPPPSQ